MSGHWKILVGTKRKGTSFCFLIAVPAAAPSRGSDLVTAGRWCRLCHRPLRPPSPFPLKASPEFRCPRGCSSSGCPALRQLLVNDKKHLICAKLDTDLLGCRGDSSRPCRCLGCFCFARGFGSKATFPITTPVSWGRTRLIAGAGMEGNQSEGTRTRESAGV